MVEVVIGIVRVAVKGKAVEEVDLVKWSRTLDRLLSLVKV